MKQKKGAASQHLMDAACCDQNFQKKVQQQQHVGYSWDDVNSLTVK